VPNNKANVAAGPSRVLHRRNVSCYFIFFQEIVLTKHILCWLILCLLFAGCTPIPQPASFFELPAEVYFDKVRGAWQAIMVANHTGLAHEGKYLDEPNSADSIELVLLDQWSTDDDTAVEWVDLHILETYGLDPTYVQIRDEWVDHLNHDIWVSTLKARQLMEQGVIPPATGSAALNPEGVWSIDAQLQTELFGLIAPGLPGEASRRAVYFARVTNSGLAVEVSAFYATLYALAFFEADLPTLIAAAQTHLSPDSPANQIVDNVVGWHQRFPTNWRQTRHLIKQAYDDDPMWWASKVNFASTLMALLYGKGELRPTITIAALAGWDADNNMTTAAGLLGLIEGYQNLPEAIRTASEVYYNEDVTGDLPQYQTVPEIAARTQALAEKVIQQVGGRVENGVYFIPVR
jgi:ADP-ribosylglycohydrolase